MKKRQVVVKRNVAGNTSDSSSSSAAAREGRIIRYGECQKNHAAYSGGYAVDGCREFMPGVGEEAALTCAACGCHRNFHKKEVLRTAQWLWVLPPPPNWFCLLIPTQREREREETQKLLLQNMCIFFPFWVLAIANVDYHISRETFNYSCKEKQNEN